MNDRRKHAERMFWLQQVAALEPNGECVDWPWPRRPEGYPNRMRSGGRRKRPVAQILLEICGVERPSPRHIVLHSCDRPPCLAPWHLRWGTDAENTQDKITRGRQPRGERVHTARLSLEIADQIREAVAGGATQASQARAYGVSQPTVHAIVYNKTWIP